jgi:hypothetical protein
MLLKKDLQAMSKARKATTSKVCVVAPSFHPWDLGSHVSHILGEQGLQVCRFATQPYQNPIRVRRLLAAAIGTHRPETVFAGSPRAMQSAFLDYCAAERVTAVVCLAINRLAPATLQKLQRSGLRVVGWYVDCFSDEPPGWLPPRLPHLSRLFLSAGGLVPACAALSKAPVEWLMEGAHVDVFPEPTCAPPRLYRSTVAFVGSIYHPAPDAQTGLRREKLLRAIQGRYDLKVWGPQGYAGTKRRWGPDYPVIEWPTYNEELVKVCRSSEVVLGINLLNHVEHYFSNRTFLTLASRGFHLTHYVPGLQTMFVNHRHLVWYHSDEECLELIEHYLARPAERSRIALDGQRLVRSKFTTRQQVARLVDSLH